MLKARQSETTETDLIVVAGTLTLFVATCGAAVFSYYEGGLQGEVSNHVLYYIHIEGEWRLTRRRDHT